MGKIELNKEIDAFVEYFSTNGTIIAVATFDEVEASQDSYSRVGI